MDGLRIEALRGPHFGPITLSAAPGERVFLHGPSGAGKTQFLRAVADLDPHDGDVRLDGVAARSTAPIAWRRAVTLVPAESHWWADRVGEHFPPDADRTALARLGFAPTVLDQSVARLSTGERQRLALLRALAHGPRVLLLDEPTAHLDADNVAAMEAELERYRSERDAILLWVTHQDGPLRRWSGRRVALRDGRVLEEAA